jgi:hypothetical protein
MMMTIMILESNVIYLKSPIFYLEVLCSFLTVPQQETNKKREEIREQDECEE